MRGSASLSLLFSAALCVIAFPLPCTAVLARTSEPVPPVLNVEDLQDALDRGDLSQWEFDLLSELVEERQEADSAEAARLAQLAGRAPMARAVTQEAQARGSLHYSVRTSVRGAGSQGQELRVLPQYRGLSVAIAARRLETRPWMVTRASGAISRGALFLQAGSLDPVWTGGLLVGRSPVLFGTPVPGWSGLWQPGRTRLRGGLARIAARRVQTELFGSSMSDSVWQHRVLGLRCRALSSSWWIESAAVAQSLQRRAFPQHFGTMTWGLSAGARVESASFLVHSALAEGAPAVQLQVAGKSAPARWQLEYWSVSGAFRNPLAHAAGEIDRELVPYPELDTSLASASTGEFGGRVVLRSGRATTFGKAQATVWREHAFQPAGVRLEAAAQHGGRARIVRLEYLHQSRSGTSEFSRRHQMDLRGQYKNLHGELGGRWTQSTAATQPRLCGRAAAGFRVHAAGTGLWEAGVAWDAYDLSMASGRFVTLRVHHSLPLGHGELAWHLRWRSAYAAHAAALSLRIDSSVYL